MPRKPPSEQTLRRARKRVLVAFERLEEHWDTVLFPETEEDRQLLIADNAECDAAIVNAIRLGLVADPELWELIKTRIYVWRRRWSVLG